MVSELVRFVGCSIVIGLLVATVQSKTQCGSGDRTVTRTFNSSARGTITRNSNIRQCEELVMTPVDSFPHKLFINVSSCPLINLEIQGQKLCDETSFVYIPASCGESCSNKRNCFITPGLASLNITYENTESGFEEEFEVNYEFVPCKVNECVYLDIIFVVDGSSSIRAPDFLKVKDWLINQTLLIYDTYGNYAQVEILQFANKDPARYNVPINESTKFTIPITLGECTNNESCVRERISSMPHISSQSYTYYALRRVMEWEFMQSSRYGQSRKIIIVITDGPANDAPLLPYWYDTYRDEVTAFAVGVGYYKVDQLRTIANGDTGNERVFTLYNFGQLATFHGLVSGIWDVIQQSEPLASGNESSACAENGLCHMMNERYHCISSEIKKQSTRQVFGLQGTLSPTSQQASFTEATSTSTDQTTEYPHNGQEKATLTPTIRDDSAAMTTTGTTSDATYETAEYPSASTVAAISCGFLLFVALTGWIITVVVLKNRMRPKDAPTEQPHSNQAYDEGDIEATKSAPAAEDIQPKSSKI